MGIEEKREFLRLALRDRLPIVYTDGAATYPCYVTQVRFGPEQRGRPEDYASLTLTEVQPSLFEGATPWMQQLQFLKEAATEAVPILFHDRYGVYRTFITQIVVTMPHKGLEKEPLVQLQLTETQLVSLFPEYEMRYDEGYYDRGFYT